MKYPVTNSQALDLVGRMYGHRGWKELAGLLAASSRSAISSDAAYIEWLLRLQGFNELHLDELVHEHAAPRQASSINNQGLDEQLRFLLESFGSQSELLKALEETVPGFNSGRAGIGAVLNCPTAGSLGFDALPWFLQATPQQLAALLAGRCSPQRAGGPEVLELARWSSEHGRESPANEQEALREFLGRRTPDVTLSLLRGPVRVFVESYPGIPAEMRPMLLPHVTRLGG